MPRCGADMTVLGMELLNGYRNVRDMPRCVADMILFGMELFNG